MANTKKTMIKNVNEQNSVSTAISLLAVGGNSVDDIKESVTLFKNDGYTTVSAIKAMFYTNTLNESVVKLQKAKIYAGVCGNADLMKELNVANMQELSDKFDLGDSKSTISEMVNVYRTCYDNPFNRLSEFIAVCEPTYTELVKIISVSAGKGRRTEEERNKDIELFLNEYAPDNNPAWTKVSELRDFVTAFKAPLATTRDSRNESENEPKNKPKNEPKSDYTTIKSVADTSKKEASTAVRQAKADGDIIENKAKGVTIVNASSVSDFMTKLVNIAKIRGCKPLDLIGDITMTIKDGN